MINGLKAIAFERAALERDNLVFSAMLEDAALQEDIDNAYASLGEVTESVTEEDIDKLIAVLPETEEDDAEVERILKSNTSDVDVDTVLGVNDVVK